MIVSEVQHPAPAAEAGVDVVATGGRRRRNARALTAPAVLIVGVAVVWAALDAFGGLDGRVKAPLTLIGLGLVRRGLGGIGTRIWGAGFDTSYWLCVGWLVVLVAATTFAAWLPLGEHSDTTKTLSDPGNLRPDLLSGHPLGTNNFSLDLLAQSIYAARVSLLTAAFAVAVSMVVGGLFGLLAGYLRGWTDTTIGIVGDTLLAFPPLILLVALAAFLGRPTTISDSIFKSGIALAIVGVPTMMRLARANTLVCAQRDFVLASRSLGARPARIILRELLPNVAMPVISYASIILAALIIAEGSLSFLGLGLQQPEPTWGNMIAEAELSVLRDAPHIALVPGVFMFLTVYSFNRLGERARHRWGAREIKI